MKSPSAVADTDIVTGFATLGPAPVLPAAEPADLLAAELDRLEMLPYSDPVAALDLVENAERRAVQSGRLDLRQRARLVRADAQGRRGEVAAAGRTANEVNSWAARHGHRHLLARSHRLLSAFFVRMGDDSSSLEHALRAVEHVGEQTPARIRADHVLSLAVALGGTGSYDAARERFDLAEDLAISLGDPALRLAVLNNLAFIEHLAGDPERALAAAERMIALAQAEGVAVELTFLDTLARAQMGLGRHAQAEQALLAGLAGQVEPDADTLAETLLTLVCAQRLQGQLDAAWTSLERCAQLCEQVGLTGLGVQVLQERAELLAAGGFYRQAYQQLQEFHVEHDRLFCAQRDARAKALQAVFETEEARRDSKRFRELSLRDPLTGLYNRRYVEERTPVLLRAAQEQGTPLCLALVDVDHFKQVNDTLSHETGDLLLRALAGVLTAVVDGVGFAARLGGDEFLLVLPGLVGPAAVQLCKTLQERVTSGVAIGMPVTISIGVACSSAEQATLAELLSGADERLYHAKRRGRSRVAG